MMKSREATMKNDENQREKQWKMMNTRENTMKKLKNRETTMKNDET